MESMYGYLLTELRIKSRFEGWRQPVSLKWRSMFGALELPGRTSIHDNWTGNLETFPGILAREDFLFLEQCRNISVDQYCARTLVLVAVSKPQRSVDAKVTA